MSLAIYSRMMRYISTTFYYLKFYLFQFVYTIFSSCLKNVPLFRRNSDSCHDLIESLHVLALVNVLCTSMVIWTFLCEFFFLKNELLVCYQLVYREYITLYKTFMRLKNHNSISVNLFFCFLVISATESIKIMGVSI